MSSRNNTSDDLIILAPYPPPYGGVAIFNQNLFEAIKEKYKNAEFWTRNEHYEENQHLNILKPGLINNFKFLINHASGKTILDSTVSSAEYPNFKFVLSWVLLKPFLKFKWIKIIHDGTLPTRHQTFSRFQKVLLKLSLTSYDKLLTVNQTLFKWAKLISPKNLNIHQITSLLPIKDQDMQTELPKSIRDTLSSCDKLVCTMGAFINNYGFKETANAVENLRKQHDLNIHLIIIAGGFTKDNDYKNELVRGRDWIHEFTDLPHSKALQILKACDIFVRGTREESYGLCKVESILCGTPVLTTNTGETRGMFLYDSHDEHQLKTQLHKILYEQQDPGRQNFPELFKQEAQQNLQSILSIISNTS